MDIPWEEEYLPETSSFYHMNIVADFCRTNWSEELTDWNDIIYCYTNKETRFMGQAVDGNIQLNKAKLGPKYPMVLYHEYGHLVENVIWSTSICKDQSPTFEQISIKEAINDVIACQIAYDGGVSDGIMYGTGLESAGGIDQRKVDNTYSYVEEGWDDFNYHVRSQALSGAIWDFKKSVGWELTATFIFQAGWLLPILEIDPPYTFRDYFTGMLYADYLYCANCNDPEYYGETPHADQLCDAFEWHDISPAAPIPEDYCGKKGAYISIVNSSYNK